MTKTKFILRTAFYLTGTVLKFAFVLWLTMAFTAPKKRWYYYQIKGCKVERIYCLALTVSGGCLYAEYGNESQRKLIHCGTFKIIDR
jgi:hypothetical protein